MQFFKSILIPVLLAVSTTVFAQQKYENEIRISRDSVPTKALAFIDTAPFDKKIRWYKEYFIDGTSIEAKTRYQGKRYSIEFDPSGELEDVEIDHRWRHAPEQVRLLMEALKARIDQIGLVRFALRIVMMHMQIHVRQQRSDSVVNEANHFCTQR